MRNKFPDDERMFQQDLSPCRSFNNVKAIFKKQIKCVKLARKLTRSLPHLEFVINNKIVVTKLGLSHHNQATVIEAIIQVCCRDSNSKKTANNR